MLRLLCILAVLCSGTHVQGFLQRTGRNLQENTETSVDVAVGYTASDLLLTYRFKDYNDMPRAYYKITDQTSDICDPGYEPYDKVSSYYLGAKDQHVFFPACATTCVSACDSTVYAAGAAANPSYTLADPKGKDEVCNCIKSCTLNEWDIWLAANKDTRNGDPTLPVFQGLKQSMTYCTADEITSIAAITANQCTFSFYPTCVSKCRYNCDLANLTQKGKCDCYDTCPQDGTGAWDGTTACTSLTNSAPLNECQYECLYDPIMACIKEKTLNADICTCANAAVVAEQAKATTTCSGDLNIFSTTYLTAGCSELGSYNYCIACQSGKYKSTNGNTACVHTQAGYTAKWGVLATRDPSRAYVTATSGFVNTEPITTQPIVGTGPTRRLGTVNYRQGATGETPCIPGTYR